MSRLSYGFVLGYHGCDRAAGEALLAGSDFRPSQNDYDWLGHGIYFWEANPLRGLEYAAEAMRRQGSSIRHPFVVGAVVELGNCLNLTTSAGIDVMKRGFKSLRQLKDEAGTTLPANGASGLLRRLDCAVVQHVHAIWEAAEAAPFDTVRGVFTEGAPAYPGAGFPEKTHIQLAVRSMACIKGVFRVPEAHLRPP